MTQTSAPYTPATSRRLPDGPCPSCGALAARAVAYLPSGRRALIEACAICGRQNVSPVEEGLDVAGVGAA